MPHHAVLTATSPHKATSPVRVWGVQRIGGTSDSFSLQISEEGTLLPQVPEGKPRGGTVSIWCKEDVLRCFLVPSCCSVGKGAGAFIPPTGSCVDQVRRTHCRPTVAFPLVRNKRKKKIEDFSVKRQYFYEEGGGGGGWDGIQQ